MRRSFQFQYDTSAKPGPLSYLFVKLIFRAATKRSATPRRQTLLCLLSFARSDEAACHKRTFEGIVLQNDAVKSVCAEVRNT